MIVGTVRNGLVEAVHPVAAVAVDSDGEVIARSGDVTDRHFYFRSAIKPVQAWVCQMNGAALGREQAAMASASHSAEPIHLALVGLMLSEVGLGPDALCCPPARPASADADRLFASLGRVAPERIMHNCSGKHASMLRACVANDWPLDYRPADHPLQVSIAAFAAEVAGAPVTPTGVDGCGIPTLRGDVLGLAQAFLAVATDPDAGHIARNVMRFTPLTSGEGRIGAEISRWVPAVVKGGAEACLGLGWPELGIAVASKCWSGNGAAAAVGLLDLLAGMGLLPDYPRRQLSGVSAPPVLGGGEPQGSLAVVER